MSAFSTLLDELHLRNTSNRGLGDSFERLIKQYLFTDPKYHARFSDVWLWNEWEGRTVEHQCKRYLMEKTLDRKSQQSQLV